MIVIKSGIILLAVTVTMTDLAVYADISGAWENSAAGDDAFSVYLYM